MDFPSFSHNPPLKEELISHLHNFQSKHILGKPLPPELSQAFIKH